MIKTVFSSIILLQVVYASSGQWLSSVDNGTLIISLPSLNEERISSSRIRGEISFSVNKQNLVFSINWGDYASFGNANVFYYIKDYGFFEKNWELSNDGKISYSPDPILMLLEILVSDSLVIGLRPKYNNEIRYIFNISNLSEYILKNKSRFAFIKDLEFYLKDDDVLSLSTNIKQSFNKNILIKRDARLVKYETRYNDMFFFNSFLSPVHFKSNLLTSKITSDLFYFNKWLRKKGILFTDVDMRIFKFFKASPIVIPYEEIHSLLLKGNNITGYRIHLNNKYIASFPKSTKDEVQSVFTFLKNR